MGTNKNNIWFDGFFSPFSADKPNRVVATNAQGYSQATDVTYSELQTIVAGGGSLMGSNNGLHVTGTIVKLGGSLIEDTSIDFSSRNLQFLTVPSNSVTDSFLSLDSSGNIRKSPLTIAEQKASLTNFRYQVSSISEPDNQYTAWPYGCLFYDASIDRVVQVYSAKDDHVGTTGIVYIRKIDYKNGLDWGARVVVADRTAESLVATTHAAGMAANGDYLCIVRFTNSADVIINTYLYRSTDKGFTWAGSQWLENGINPINPAEAGSVFKTATGTLLTYYRGSSGNYVTRSSDNGVTWSNKPVSNPIGDTPLEGGFVQVPDGTIVCVVRSGVGGPIYPSKLVALFTKSTDDGLTWSPLALTNIADMTSNPAALLFHTETNNIEIVYGSRFSQSDGYSSLWQSNTSIGNLKLGIFNAPTRIAIGSGTRDFGYPAMCKTPDGHVIIGYYNGLSGKTSINYMVGRRGQSPDGTSTNPYNLLRNPATFEPHADFSTAIDVATKRSLMGLKNLSYVNFSINPTVSAGSYGILTINSSTNNVESVASTTFSPSSGGSGYIQNQSSVVQTASFKISGTGETQGVLRSTLASGGSIEISGVGLLSGAINLPLSGGALMFNASGVTGMQMVSATKNIIIQNGGTFTDTGEGIQVNRNARFTATQSAGTGIARGILINPTLTATANNDTLVALDINSTFNNGAFSPVTQLTLRTNGIIRSVVATGGAVEIVGVGIGTGAINTVNSGGGLLFQSGGTTGMEMMPTTRNIVIQNGGTFTDNGFKLDVFGNTRITGNLTVDTLVFKTKTTDPVAADIPAGQYQMYKNTTSGVVKLWANDGGTLKSVTLT